MATLVLTTIGTAIAGPFGGMVGGLLGGAIDRSFSGAGGDRTTEGPRLKNLNIQTSSYGEALSQIYGSMRTSGNVIWSNGLKEERHSKSENVGSGKNSSSVTNVTYTYSASFAVALSARKIDTIGRIWADGKLLREASGSLATGGEIRIYDGSASQKKDAFIEAVEGSSNVNSFRNIAYVMFEGLALGEYANRIPNLTFEVIGDAGGGISLKRMVIELCNQVGLRRINADDLDQNVKGYVVSGAVKMRSVLEDLSAAYHFDIIQENGGVTFKKISRNSELTLNKDEVVSLRSSRPDISITRTQDLELPKEISLSYIDPARDYQMGLQRAKRARSNGIATFQRQMPLVLGAEDAKKISEIHLDRAWKEREYLSFILPYKYGDLVPGDVVILPLKTGFKKILIKNIEFSEQGFECDAVTYGDYFSVRNIEADSGSVPPQTVEELALSELTLLDMPPVNGEDIRVPILFWAVQAKLGRWAGASLLMSSDNGASFKNISSSSSENITGMMRNILAEGNDVTWDMANKIHVSLNGTDFQLENATALEVLNGSNIAWVGGEIIQFQKAEKQINGHYILSGLLRGRRGTEHLISSHLASETFILITPSMASAGLLLADVGRTSEFKLVTHGGSEDEISPVIFHYQANSLKPFSPVQGIRRKSVNGDIEFSWLRRSRVGGEWLDSIDIPLGELYEKYEVDIMKQGNVIRTLTVNIASVIYKVSDQIEDFGNAQTDVTARIYQLSDYVGRGHVLTI